LGERQKERGTLWTGTNFFDTTSSHRKDLQCKEWNVDFMVVMVVSMVLGAWNIITAQHIKNE
jgi:hypothetical protein